MHRARVATYCFATLHMVQNIYFQYWESYLPFLVSFLSTPAGQQYWDTRRGLFDAGFAQMMDQRFARADALAPAVKSNKTEPQNDALETGGEANI